MSESSVTTKVPATNKIASLASSAGRTAELYARTVAVVVFIINSVLLAMYGFGLVKPSAGVLAIAGAIAVAYATVVLFTFVHNGVKNQSNVKRKR